MALDLTTLTDYAWSDIQKAAKAAMVNAALGGSNLNINGRAIGRISISEAKILYDTATQMMVDEANTEAGGTVLVRYGERV
jgi:hypothetical protein